MEFPGQKTAMAGEARGRARSCGCAGFQAAPPLVEVVAGRLAATEKSGLAPILSDNNVLDIIDPPPDRD
jgi:hypothetical protein